MPLLGQSFSEQEVPPHVLCPCVEEPECGLRVPLPSLEQARGGDVVLHRGFSVFGYYHFWVLLVLIFVAIKALVKSRLSVIQNPN